MRVLNCKELENVSGGDWSFEVDLGVTKWVVSGDESIQDMAGSAAGAVAGAYGGAVDAMADFFTWMDPAGYYGSACTGGGGGR